MRLTAIFTAAAFLAGSTAAAQVPGQPAPPRVPQIDQRAMYGGTSTDSITRLTRDALDRQRETGGQSEERVSLIERIAPLVAEGRCNEARRLAREEGDRAVSRRIGEVCVEGRPTPMSTAPAN